MFAHSSNDHLTKHIMKTDEQQQQQQHSPSARFKSNHKNRRHLQLNWPLSWIIFMVSLSSVSSEMIYRVDPLGKYNFVIVTSRLFLYLFIHIQILWFWWQYKLRTFLGGIFGLDIIPGDIQKDIDKRDENIRLLQYCSLTQKPTFNGSHNFSAVYNLRK